MVKLFIVWGIPSYAPQMSNHRAIFIHKEYDHCKQWVVHNGQKFSSPGFGYRKVYIKGRKV